MITKNKPLEVESKTAKRKDGTTVEFIEVLPEKSSSEEKEIVNVLEIISSSLNDTFSIMVPESILY